MIQKSIFSCNEFIIDDKLVFVVCPFKDEFDAIYEDHIKKMVTEELSMNCLRADEIYSNCPIIDDIWRLINEAKVIVADLTERNPNVFYEVGLAHAIGKEVILLAQSVEDIPFDLRHLRTIIYKNDYRGQTELHETLKKTITAIVH
jgi:nucleoside 2-deoxyribosyltransferase